jgi:hypothetical protein
VMRIWGHDILGDLDGVICRIAAALLLPQ